jgi:hypothetical protein
MHKLEAFDYPFDVLPTVFPLSPSVTIASRNEATGRSMRAGRGFRILCHSGPETLAIMA